MKIKQIDLLRFGCLTTGEEEKEYSTDSISGYFLRPATFTFIDSRDKIEGSYGLKFGIEYFIAGHTTDEFADATFSCRILHPLLTNPETGDSSSETIEIKNDYLNKTNFDYFHFEYNWEVQKGIWTFQLLEGKHVKLEKTFEIL